MEPARIETIKPAKADPSPASLALLAITIAAPCPPVCAAEVQECRQIPTLNTYCGISCVKVVCDLHHVSMTWELAARLVQPDARGVSTLSDLVRALSRVGLVPVAVQCGFDDLAGFSTPAILHLAGHPKEGHFVVCARVRHDVADIIEYPQPPKRMSRLEIERTWRGTALLAYADREAVPPRLRPGAHPSTAPAASPATGRCTGPPAAIGPLRCDGSTLDFEKVPRYSLVRGAFTFRNTSSVRVRIPAVRASCACTSALAFPPFIDPGATGDVAFEIDTRDHVGPQSRSLVVHADENGIVSSGELHIRYEVIQDVFLKPACVDFGDVPSGQPTKRTIELTNVARGSGRIAAVRSSVPFVHPSEPAYLDPHCLQAKITLHLDPGAAHGPFTGMVTFVFEGAENETLDVPIEGNVESAIQVVPSRLAFGILSPGQTVARRVLLKSKPPINTSWGPLSVQSGTDGITATLEPAGAPWPALKVTLAVPPDAPSGFRKGTLRLGLPASAANLVIPYSFIVDRAMSAPSSD